VSPERLWSERSMENRRLLFERSVEKECERGDGRKEDIVNI
jgi:hypothetical protein